MKPKAFETTVAFQPEEGVKEDSQPEILRHPAQIPDDWGIEWKRGSSVTIKRKAAVHDTHFFGWNSEPRPRCFRIIPAGGDKHVHIGRAAGNQIPDPFPICVAHQVDPFVFILQGADDFYAEIVFEAPGETEQEGVGKMNNLRLQFIFQETHEHF